MPSELEHRYTSTGIKWWRHVQQMEAYRAGTANTLISTHVSPEGACNLKCPYCSVTHRDTHSRIDPDDITNYLMQCKKHGLKAVIFTGGGEPTAYKWINGVIQFAHETLGLRCALITNGTMLGRLNFHARAALDWMRISVNFFDGWKDAIRMPVPVGLRPDCVVGLSTVFTDRHEDPDQLAAGWKALYQDVAELADRVGAKYVRVLPNCLLPEQNLADRHRQLDQVLADVKDDRFFHQHKVHRAPDVSICHQAYFRPYLSEEPNPFDGRPGTVFPCDSVVLNKPVPGSPGFGKFMEKFAICRPGDIGKFLRGEIEQPFSPRHDCNGCVFTRTVEMLGQWKGEGVGEFSGKPLEHEAFV